MFYWHLIPKYTIIVSTYGLLNTLTDDNLNRENINMNLSIFIYTGISNVKRTEVDLTIVEPALPLIFINKYQINI